MRFSVAVVILFVFGIVLGTCVDVSFSEEVFVVAEYTLYALLVAVGVMVGMDKGHLRALVKVRAESFVLPIITILGTVFGSLCVSFFFPSFSWKESIIAGGGLGYYSLSGIIVSEGVGAELGAITLISNLLRELLVILFIPILYRYFGPYAIICGAGATSMDTTLPLLTNAAGNSIAIPAIFHGFLMSALVPVLLTYLISILVF